MTARKPTGRPRQLRGPQTPVGPDTGFGLDGPGRTDANWQSRQIAAAHADFAKLWRRFPADKPYLLGVLKQRLHAVTQMAEAEAELTRRYRGDAA